MTWVLGAIALLALTCAAGALLELRARGGALVKWAHTAIDHMQRAAELSRELDRRARQIDDRDHAIQAITQDRDRAVAGAAAVRRQRDDAVGALEQLAQQHPQALGAAVRGQLDRLRELPHAGVAGVPGPAADEARDRGGEHAVHGAAAAVRDPAVA